VVIRAWIFDPNLQACKSCGKTILCQAHLWLLLGHLVNHGTHHRGELTAMFALLEVPHKENDFYYYFLIQDGQMED
jgi:uncharacterized damage-inducible protein DinB